MRINKKNIRKIIIELSIEYEVRLHFTESKIMGGSARYWNNSISVSMKQSPASMISSFFHEMGHIYCWENSLWKSYHINKPIEYLTKKEKIKYFKTALKAERWVDRWASKEMKKHFHDIKYQDGYLSEKEGLEFSNHIRKIFSYE